MYKRQPGGYYTQQGMNQLGINRGQGGGYQTNPFGLRHVETRFEPMAMTFNILPKDSYPPLTSVPETPKKLKDLKDNQERLEALEAERDAANTKNYQIRNPESDEAPTKEAPATISEIAPTKPIKAKDPSFLAILQDFITISSPQAQAPTVREHRNVEEESFFPDFFSIRNTPSPSTPIIEPYTHSEGVILKPSRYQERRSLK